MANLAELLAYKQKQNEMLNSLPPVPTLADSERLHQSILNTPVREPTFGEKLDMLSAAAGEGFVDQLEGIKQLVTHPVQSVKDVYSGVKYAVQNPRQAAQAAVEGLKGAVQSPESVTRFLAQNFSPVELANALKNVGTMRNIYMPTRPKMPAEVGTRYTTVDKGGLLPKKPFNLEEHKGSSILITPWDLTSRNKLITSVSDDPLLNPVLTHGGQQYARDIQHQAQNVAGASAEGIVNRIADRVDVARAENLAQGGTGNVLQTPITMADYSEIYSVTPTQIMFDFIDRAEPSKKKIKEINDFIKKPIAGHKAFPDFAGIETPQGRQQLLDIDSGQMRKKFIDKMYKEDNEKYFGFNRQDASNATADTDLLGVPRGYGLNTVISHGNQPLILTPSTNMTYPTNFSGEYAGSLANVPVEVFMPGVYRNIAKEYANSTYLSGKNIGKPWTAQTLNDAVIGALEKRKAGVSQIINDEMINRVGEYLTNQQVR